MFKEFKKFIARGNVMDLTVGVIVGGAFSTIVSSLVNNILMPIIGVITGGVDFSTGLTIQVKDATINYGAFLQSVLDFLIISFCIFLMVKTINTVLAKLENKEEEKKEKPKKSDEVILLEEIRDALKGDKKETKKEIKKSPRTAKETKNNKVTKTVKAVKPKTEKKKK